MNTATIDLINEELEHLLTFPDSPYQNLFDAANYSLFSGGKRLRPQLTLTTCCCLGGDPKIALRPACAIELIHTYSMIHDDLPCMDDDNFRRGKPTLHKQFDEAQAVLTGDFLLTYAFQVLAEDPQLNAEQITTLVQILSRSSGGEGMIAGQILDIIHTDSQISKETLLLIHQKKTAALLTAAIQFGAVLSPIDEKAFENVTQFGQAIGLAFQIIDDILDVTAAEKKHGVSSDVLNDKTTYVSLLGIDEAEKEAADLLEKAQNHLKNIPGDLAPLSQLAERLVLRSY